MYIYLNVCKQITDFKLFLLHSNTWNHSTVYKNSLGFFKNVINWMCSQFLYLIYTYKQYLVLNNLLILFTRGHNSFYHMNLLKYTLLYLIMYP